MKKALFLFTALLVITSSFAAFEIKPSAKKATEIYFPVGSTGHKLSLMEISTIDIKDFEKISGRHLNFIEKMAFKGGQRKLRKSISKDGTITSKRLIKFVNGDGDHSTGFHLGGFALGFFLGLIGVVLAYVIGGDEDVKRNRAKWSWIGFGTFAVLYIALVLVLLNNVE
jgi:hypothetical protein